MLILGLGLLLMLRLSTGRAGRWARLILSICSRVRLELMCRRSKALCAWEVRRRELLMLMLL